MKKTIASPDVSLSRLRAASTPRATQRIEDDEDDEIKGQALEATFPSIFGVADVLAALTPPRNERLLGIYR